MNKKAIELSLNFLIVTILSLVVFGFGIFMMNKFTGEADDKVLVWEGRMQNEIEDILDDGSKVAIPFDHKVIGNKKFDTFGVGILNILNLPETTFEVDVRFSKAYKGSVQLCDSTDTTNCGVDPDTWISSTEGSGGPLTITKNIRKYDKEKFLIGVDVKDAAEGTYIFDLEVTAIGVPSCAVDPVNIGYRVKRCDEFIAAESIKCTGQVGCIFLGVSCSIDSLTYGGAKPCSELVSVPVDCTSQITTDDGVTESTCIYSSDTKYDNVHKLIVEVKY
ncbi:MAG: hypothetical protein ABIC04_08050 [Nanoarchaeota archaeon]